MKILIACEFSGTVWKAFTDRGHNVMSCDMLPSELSTNHYQGDVRDILYDDWDMIIAHPPCTYLSQAGIIHFYIGRKKENGFNLERFRKMEEAIKFFLLFLNHPAAKIAVENPVMVPWAREKIRSYDQIINPFNFGHKVQKRTCIWLKGLPPLMSTKRMLDRGEHYITRKGKKNGPYWFQMQTSGADRTKIRSRTFPGIAAAMAAQWG